MRMAESVTTSFFKVILSSTLQEGKMKFPKKFAKERGGELPETVRLCLPTGRCWSVSIERESDDAIWLHDGLHKFIEDNSIGIEYFLVFKYDGNSEFGVIIFDLTAAEIQYTCIDDSINRENIDQTLRAETRESENGSGNCARGEAESDDSAIEYLGSSRVGVLQGTNRGSRSYFTRRRKQVMESDIISDRSMRKLRERNATNENNHGKKSNTYKDKTRNDDTGGCAAGSGKERIVEPIYQSSPNLFKVTLTSSYIKKGVLRVPSDFSKLHMSNSTRFIKLIDAENNEWVVRYIHRGYNNVLSSGWRHFVEEKKLIAGDVCIFERVRGDKEVKLRVTISSSDEKNSTTHKDTRRNDGMDISPSEPVDKSSPNFFKVTLKPWHIQKGYLYVTCDFALLHMPDSSRLIKLVDAENNKWLVRYIHQGNRSILSSGWRHFVLDKKLMGGDVCILKRVQGDDEVKLRVTISRSGKHLK